MISSALGVSASSLLAQQKAISVLANNIANANTKGYSRETPQLGTRASENLGGLTFGRGVKITAVTRQADTFIQKSEIANGTDVGYYAALKKSLLAVEPVFGSLTSSSLSPALDSFFKSSQLLANSPSSQSSKSSVISAATNLTNNIKSMKNSLTQALTSSNTDLTSSVNTINSILTKIGQVSVEINHTESTSASTANGLRDQRDVLVRDLSKKMDIQLVDTKGFLLQSRSGEILVQDGTVNKLNISVSSTSSQVSVGNNPPMTQSVIGGDLGGKLDANVKYKTYISNLDDFSSNLIQGINNVYSSGTSSVPKSSYTSDFGSIPTVALNSATQTSPFATSIKTGSFRVHQYNAAGVAVAPLGGTVINITAGVSTMNSVSADLTAAGYTTTIAANGAISISAPAGNKMAFSDDTSGFLSSSGINTLLSGSSSKDISVKATVNTLNNATASSVDSTIATDGALASSIFSLTNSSFGFTTSGQDTLTNRVRSMITTFTSDLSLAQSQSDFYQFRATAIKTQRLNVSQVNIDTEMVSMIKFQQAYKAASKVIQVNNDMLTSLMGLIR